MISLRSEIGSMKDNFSMNESLDLESENFSVNSKITDRSKNNSFLSFFGVK